MGRPHDADGQRAVLRAALGVLEAAAAPGTYVELPFEWPESPVQARRAEHVAPPIAALLRRKPWLLARLIAGDVRIAKAVQALHAASLAAIARAG